MAEELEQFCLNCKKKVGAANFVSHSAFCLRNIKICKVCDEPVPKNSIKEHEEEYHIYVRCTKCNASVMKWKMPKHQEVCPKRMITCEFCEAEIFANEAEEHIGFCGSRTEFCECCSKYIMLKHKKEHFKLHQSEEKFHKENGVRAINQNKRDEFSSKISEKTDRMGTLINFDVPLAAVRARFARVPAGMPAAAAARVPTMPAPRGSPTLAPVVNCMLQFQPLSATGGVHPAVALRVPPAPMPQLRCNPLPQRVQEPSVLSMQSAPPTRFLAPAGLAPRPPPAPIPTVVAPVPTAPPVEQMMQENLSAKQRLTEGDQAGVCPFCKKRFNPLEILVHTGVCSKKYFHCNLCWEQVLREERNKHITYQCKMLQDENSSDLYECQLCGEQLLFEKDKSAHETFACRALLRGDESSISLRDENTSKNCAKETKKLAQEDPAQVCPFCIKEFNPYIIMKHIDACSKKYFQCDLCWEHVLREERDNHLNYQCKMLQEEIPSDFYECQLCGEQVLKKDKSAHETFSCRVLLQIDESLNSLGLLKPPKIYPKEIEKRKICAYCDKELHVNDSEAHHLRVCEVYKQINSDSSHISQKAHSASASVERLRCIICIDKERDTVLQPCGHLVVCNNCANDVQSTCPMCRKHVQNKIKVYIN